MVRSGISIYGLYSVENSYKRRLKLKPALSWHTKIIQIKEIPKGTFVGYSRSFRAKKDMKIALLPVGYWDGYDRKLSNTAKVLINGKLCSIVGKICMNLCMVDVTMLPKVKTGDTVTLLGKQAKKYISASNLAEWAKTINYEIITRINPLIIRKLTK